MRLLKILILLILVVLLSGGYIYILITGTPSFSAETDEDIEILIPSNASYEAVIGNLQKEHGLSKPKLFDLLARQMNYTQHNIKPGRYVVPHSISMVDCIRKLRSGDQNAVKVTFNNVRDIEELSQKITTELELDSASFLKFLKERIAEDPQWDRQTILALFIPNTYKIYWNESAYGLFKRMRDEYDKFWNKNDRRQKAEALGLSQLEVSILASIVEKETQVNSEKSRIAGVYLNRLRKGMRLQADPTVVFANGDFTLKRVLFKHLEKDSPYNTYKYSGLPPGPICMPEISSLNAVLNAENHNFLYFCASPDFSGKHQFAKTLSQHNVNAQRYQRWLSQQNIN